MTNTKKDRKQKIFYGGIEALADARRALKKWLLNSEKWEGKFFERKNQKMAVDLLTDL